MQDAKEKQKKRQAENNKRVMQRMQNPNDTLMTCEVDALWWQPRYVDKEKIKRMKKKTMENTSNEV